jgi:hypothetical protein
MNATRVISFDLDDTLWPVGPVIAAAEAALFDWLAAHYPRTVRGHTLGSMRAMRTRLAARFPERSHDLTFLRRRALGDQFAAAGYAMPSSIAAASPICSTATSPRSRPAPPSRTRKSSKRCAPSRT